MEASRERSLSPAQPNQSLADGLRVLQLLCATGPVGSRDCGRRLDIEATRANRLLKTMAASGIIRQREDRKYEPGPALQVMAASARHESRLLSALGPMHGLLQFRLGVCLGVVWGDQVCRLHRLGAALELPELIPGEQTAVSHVLRDGLASHVFVRHAESASLAVIVPHVIPFAALELVGRISKLDIPRLLPPLHAAANAIAAEERRLR